MKTWILQRFQVYGRVMLMLGLFLSPVVFNRNTQDVFNLLKFSVLWITGFAALALYIAWAAERGVWMPRFNIAYAALAFLFVGVLATIFSESPIVSVVGLYHRYGGLLPFTLYAIIMLAMVGLYWEKPADLREIAVAAAWASVLLTAYVLIQKAGQDWIPWKDANGGPPEFPVGTMGNSNFAGGYLGIAVPFVLYVATTAKRDIYKFLGFAFLGLDLLALWFTQTRGGMIAAIVGLLALAFGYRDRLPRWVRIGTAISTLLAILLAFLILVHPGSDKPPGPLANVKTFRTQTFSVRTFYWGTAIRIFEHHPIIGTGLDLYYANYTLFRLPEDGAQLGLTITDKPHNIFLEYAADAGALGILSYLVMVGLGLWYGFRYSKRFDDVHRFTVIAFSSVLAGYLAQGVFSIDVPPLAVMGWVALGGIAAIADPRIVKARLAALETKREGRPGKRKPIAQPVVRTVRHGPPLWPVHASALIAIILVVVLGALPVVADAKAKDGLSGQSVVGQETTVTKNYEKAIRLNPLEASYRSQAGAWEETLGAKANDKPTKLKHFKRAEAYYQKGLRMQPGNIFFLINLARLQTTWADSVDPAKYPEAEKSWKQSVDHDPTDWDVHNRYALMLNSYANARSGDTALRAKSIGELETVTRIHPVLIDAWLNLTKIYRALGQVDKAKKALAKAKAIDPNNGEVVSLTAEFAVL